MKLQEYMKQLDDNYKYLENKFSRLNNTFYDLKDELYKSKKLEKSLNFYRTICVILITGLVVYLFTKM